MRPKILILPLIFICFLKFGYSQTWFPDDGEIFAHNVIPRIDITIHPDTLNWLYDNVDSEREFRARFIFNNGKVNDTLQDIGFRLRGNTSRVSLKKSFKLSFNTFVKGREYHGLEKMNLNGEHNDPSVSRALLYWKILRTAEIVGPRANHVKVYINGNYYGLYLNVEHIDEEFTEKYFGNGNGNLYKCYYGADLTYKGSSPNNYKFQANGQRVYELKTNEAEDDYSDLAHFIKVLNNTSVEDLPCAIENLFNVQSYLKIAALDVITGNWDGYIFNKNNYYLYHNPSSGLIEYIPYDTDNTFGIDWFNINWSKRNIYNWSYPDQPRPLFRRLMQVPEYKAQYTAYIKEIIENITSQDWFSDYINHVKTQIRPHVAFDMYYTLDYGYNINSFDKCWSEGIGDHVPVGITQYLNTRNSSALSQCLNLETRPVVNYISHNKPLKWQINKFTSMIIGNGIEKVELTYTINNSLLQTMEMYDNGQHGDSISGDRIYTTMLSGMEGGTILNYQVKITTASDIVLKPCQPITYQIPALNPNMLFINEFMAGNSSSIVDEFGEADDWIELYNDSEEDIWLGDKYLSDNPDNLNKWALPDTNIKSKGFLIIWADDQMVQGTSHASFKLSTDTEDILLVDNQENGYRVIDFISYKDQSSDVSFGRSTDGGYDWKYFGIPTPGVSNGKGVIAEKQKIPIDIWPNPLYNDYLFISEVTDLNLYDIAGRKLSEYVSTAMIDLSYLKAGIYIILTKDGRSARLIRH